MIDDERPTIRLSAAELHGDVTKTIEALASDRALYQRDGHLVHVVRVDAPMDAGVTWEPGTPQIRTMATATLRERATRVVIFEKFDKRAEEWFPCLPPPAIIDAVAARGEWKGIRLLVGVIETPSFRVDGSIIDRPGYDDASGYLYEPSQPFERVRPLPTEAHARAAFEALREVFLDFPFATSAALEVAVAAVLTLIARPMIAGPSPAFLFDASTRGSGKSLQTDAIAIIATGRGAARMNWPTNDEELEKVLGAYALRGASLVSFDNMSRPFCGAPLDRCLTANDRVELRILGKTEVPSLRWRAVILGTGNNVIVDGDTARRVLVSRMEPAREDPENRPPEEFRHPDLLGWVRAERPRLVRAAMTMVAAWVAAGRPKTVPGTWGSFESWVSVIPQVIAFSGGANVLTAKPARDAGHDSEASALIAIMGAVETLTRETTGITARDLLARLYPQRDRRDGPAPPDGFDDARSAIETVVRTKPGQPPDAKSVGKFLARQKGRIVSGKKLVATAGHGGILTWTVVGWVGSVASPVPHAREVASDTFGNSTGNQATQASQPTSAGAAE